MAVHLLKRLPRTHFFSYPSARLIPLIVFCTIIFFYALADGIMAYFAPVYLESYFQNTFIMGLVLSSSSVVGLAADIIIGDLMHGKKFSIFAFWGIILALFFPASFFLLPPWVPFFIVSMAIWGVYYEFISFSKFHFINSYLPHDQHDLGWAVLSPFNDTAYFVGPLIAGILLSIYFKLPLFAAIGFLLIALIILLVFLKTHPERTYSVSPKKQARSVKKEFKIWKILIKPLWPVLLFVLMLTILDATFWTIGAILAENIKQETFLGNLLFVAYLTPSLFMGLVAIKIAKPLGKKRTAFWSAGIAGLIFIMAGFLENSSLFIAAIFFASIFLGVAWPEIRGAEEDYIERLKSNANELIALENSMTSIGYIIGATLSGGIAELLGPKLTFSVMGVLIVITSVLCLLVVPRKIHLPQQAIADLEAEP